MLRIAIAGGGTGGHIYPALAILRAFERRFGRCEFLYLGTEHGLEAELVPRAGIRFRTIRSKGIPRRISIDVIRSIGVAVAGVWDSIQALREFSPQVVIGTGGYVCGPVLLAARLLGIPTLIQEQNVVPGVTNRMLARVVDRVALGYEEAKPYFPAAAPMVHTGNPIRAELLQADRRQGLERFALRGDRPVVVVMGGSQGAKSINAAMIEAYPLLADHAVQFLHITGQREYETVRQTVRELQLPVEQTDRIHLEPYVHEMALAFAVADLVVSRAGALGLAEIAAKGIPAILIPYPHAAANHQEKNARCMLEAGAALLLHDRELNGRILLEAITNVLENEEKRRSMQEASRKMGRPQAADAIVALATEIMAPQI